jgi:hypothetical protein
MTRRTTFLILVFGFLFGVSACGGGAKSTEGKAPASSERKPIPADLRAEIARSESIGRALYLVDKVSAIGTDVLLANVKAPEQHGLAGYLALPEMDTDAIAPTFWVIFYTKGPEPTIPFRIRIPPNGAKPTFEEITPPNPTPETLRTLIRARETALAAPRDTQQAMNPVVLPAGPAGEAGFLVYLLAGTTRPDVAVFGKHFRVLVSEDGRTIKRFDALTKAPLELPLVPPDAAAGGRVAALTMTHIVSDYPLETHVFGSLLYRLPVYVATGRGLWNVDGDHIAFLGK